MTKLYSYHITSNGYTIGWKCLHEGKCLEKFKKKFAKDFSPNCVFTQEAQPITAARTPCAMCGIQNDPVQAEKELARRSRLLAVMRRQRLEREYLASQGAVLPHKTIGD